MLYNVSYRLFYWFIKAQMIQDHFNISQIFNHPKQNGKYNQGFTLNIYSLEWI